MDFAHQHEEAFNKLTETTTPVIANLNKLLDVITLEGNTDEAIAIELSLVAREDNPTAPRSVKMLRLQAEYLFKMFKRIEEAAAAAALIAMSTGSVHLTKTVPDELAKLVELFQFMVDNFGLQIFFAQDDAEQAPPQTFNEEPVGSSDPRWQETV